VHEEEHPFIHPFLCFTPKTIGRMKMAAFWVVVPCSLVEVSNVSEVLVASITITLMMQAAITFGMSINFYQTTQCYNTLDSGRQYEDTCCHENLNSYLKNWSEILY
jgi:hypothetical protein